MKTASRFVFGLALLAMSFVASPGYSVADENKDIVENAVSAGKFKTLVAAVKAADLVETLKGKGPFTVFAPTDEAFAKLPKGTIEKLLEEPGRKTLKQILLYHVVPGKVMAADVAKVTEAKTALGKMVTVNTDGGKVTINGAQVITADIVTSNGVIHIIDRVILPPKE